MFGMVTPQDRMINVINKRDIEKIKQFSWKLLQSLGKGKWLSHIPVYRHTSGKHMPNAKYSPQSTRELLCAGLRLRAFYLCPKTIFFLTLSNKATMAFSNKNIKTITLIFKCPFLFSILITRLHLPFETCFWEWQYQSKNKMVIILYLHEAWRRN